MIDFAKKNDAILIFSMNSANFENIIHDKNILVEILFESSFDSRREKNSSIAFD